MTAASGKRTRASTRILAVAFGGLVGLAGALLLLAILYGDPLDPVARQDYERALARWRASDVEDYDLAVRVSGAQQAMYEVQVRGGEVTQALRNGRPILRATARDVWSVDGMFEVISEDLALAELAAAGAAPQGAPRLSLSARWHPELGYPERYRRLMTASGDTNWAQRVAQGGAGAGPSGAQSAWEIVRFEPQ